MIGSMNDGPAAGDAHIINDILTEDIKGALDNNINIIPVIGFELLPVLAAGQRVPYLDYLSRHIASKHGIALPREAEGFALFNHTVHELFRQNNFDKLRATRQLSENAKEIHNLVDRSYLEKIAAIVPFKYFFNITFTTHLNEVIGKVRTFPETNLKQTSFPFQLNNPKRPVDVVKNDCAYEGSVYNLFGLAYVADKIKYDYYYSDDDILEFIPEFNKRYEVDLKNYKEVVSESSLLFLGCQHPDWLVRVLINTLKPGSLNSFNNLQARIFFDYSNDASNSFFLDRHRFRFQRNLQTAPLINQLHRKLVESNFTVSTKSKKFIFVSYTRDNLALVRKIVCQLASKVSVWFDRVKMFPGDLINDEVKAGIDNCSLFLPIITPESVNKRPEDYVRQEWTYYREKFRDASKVIPLVLNQGVNLGQLGFDLDAEFGKPRANIFYLQINHEGIDEQDIIHLENKL